MVKIRPPLLIERKYQTEMRKLLNETKKIVEDEVLRYLPQILDQGTRSDAERFDDLASKITALFMIARGKVDALLAMYAVERTIQGLALLINEFNTKQFQRMVKSKLGEYRLGPGKLGPAAQLQLMNRIPGAGPDRATRLNMFKLLQNSMGVDSFADNPKLRETLNVWVVNNVNLVKDVHTTFLNQSEKVIFEGAQKGLRHEALAKQILEETDLDKGRFKTAKTRANLIARDQTGKLNGTLNRLRQQDIGIKKYTWRGIMDARERHSHVMSEGRIYTWEKGNPSLGGAHPSEEIQCRCWADPEINIDDLLADLDDE